MYGSNVKRDFWFYFAVFIGFVAMLTFSVQQTFGLSLWWSVVAGAIFVAALLFVGLRAYFDAKREAKSETGVEVLQGQLQIGGVFDERDFNNFLRYFMLTLCIEALVAGGLLFSLGTTPWLAFVITMLFLIASVYAMFLGRRKQAIWTAARKTDFIIQIGDMWLTMMRTLPLQLGLLLMRGPSWLAPFGFLGFIAFLAGPFWITRFARRLFPSLRPQ